MEKLLNDMSTAITIMICNAVFYGLLAIAVYIFY
jgi:hypothetical protein